MICMRCLLHWGRAVLQDICKFPIQNTGGKKVLFPLFFFFFSKSCVWSKTNGVRLEKEMFIFIAKLVSLLAISLKQTAITKTTRYQFVKKSTSIKQAAAPKFGFLQKRRPVNPGIGGPMFWPGWSWLSILHQPETL